MLKVGTKAWQAEYAKRVGKAMDILTRGGRRVYWVGNPIMRNSVYRDKTAMIDKIYAAEAKKHPGVQYISTWMLFADEKGGYAEALPDGERRPRDHARPRRRPPHARRRRPHGAGRAGRHREGLGHPAAAVSAAAAVSVRPAAPAARSGLVDPVPGEEQPEGEAGEGP